MRLTLHNKKLSRDLKISCKFIFPLYFHCQFTFKADILYLEQSDISSQYSFLASWRKSLLCKA
jgi:hypothetical protein